MKNLQNNFTTPLESMYMLEFGVPADSADLYYDKDEVEIDKITQPYILPFNIRFSNFNDMFYLPCWSVGRLMEIFDICYLGTDVNAKWENHNSLHKYQTYMNYIIYLFETNYMRGKLDFSKLEE